MAFVCVCVSANWVPALFDCVGLIC